MTTVSAARQPSSATVRVTRPLALGCGVIGFALLTWAGAKASVPLPFTPVPGTLQMLPVLLAGALLGARGGAASQIAYLLMGIAGLPVFALPGAGPAYLLGPTAGYLLGFVAAAYVAGRAIGGRRPAGAARAFLGFVAGSAALHLCGLAWLTALAGGHLGAAVRAGLQPFLLFDLAKIVLATGVYTAWERWRWTRARTRDDATPR